MARVKKKMSKSTALGLTSLMVVSAIVPSIVTYADETAPTPTPDSGEVVAVENIEIGEVVVIENVKFVKYAETVNSQGKQISLFTEITKTNPSGVTTGVNGEETGFLYEQFLSYTKGTAKLDNPIVVPGYHRTPTTFAQKERLIEVIDQIRKGDAYTYQVAGKNISLKQRDASGNILKSYLNYWVTGQTSTISLGTIPWASGVTTANRAKYASIMDAPKDIFAMAADERDFLVEKGYSVPYELLGIHLEMADIQAIAKNVKLGKISPNEMPTFFGVDTAMTTMTAYNGDYSGGSATNYYANFTMDATGSTLTKYTNQKTPTYSLKLAFIEGDTFVTDGTTASGKPQYKYVADEIKPGALKVTANGGSNSTDSSMKTVSIKHMTTGFEQGKHVLTGFMVREAYTGKETDVDFAEGQTSLNFTDGRFTLASTTNDVDTTKLTIGATRTGAYYLNVKWKDTETGEEGVFPLYRLMRGVAVAPITSNNTYTFNYNAGDRTELDLDVIFGKDIYTYDVNILSGQNIITADVDAYANKLKLTNSAEGSAVVSVKATQIGGSGTATKVFNLTYAPSTVNAPKLLKTIPTQYVTPGEPLTLNLAEYFDTRSPQSFRLEMESSDASVVAVQNPVGTSNITLTPRANSGEVTVTGYGVDNFGTSQQFQFEVIVGEGEEEEDTTQKPTVLWSLQNPTTEYLTKGVPQVTLVGGKATTGVILKGVEYDSEGDFQTDLGVITLTPDGKGNTILNAPNGLGDDKTDTTLNLEVEGVNFLDLIIKAQPKLNFTFN